MYTAIFGYYPKFDGLRLLVHPVGIDLPEELIAVRIVGSAHSYAEALMLAMPAEDLIAA